MEYRVDEMISLEEEYCYADYELDKLNLELYMLHSLSKENELTKKSLISLLSKECGLYSGLEYTDRCRVIDNIQNAIHDAEYATGIFNMKINELILDILDKTHERDSLALTLGL